MRPEKTNIVLVGFMGSGKSSIGRQTAARMRFQFVDTDELIVARNGKGIPELFAEFGEAHFRELETRVIESCSMLKRTVIATGGGSVVKSENHVLIRNLGFVVQLTAAAEVIFERVSRNTHRPLLQTHDPRGTVTRMLAERVPLYEQVADFTVDNTSITHAASVEQIVKAARQAFGWV